MDMEALLWNTASGLILDAIIVYIFASFVVEVFQIGQQKIYVRIEQANDTRAYEMFSELPFIERIGYIVMYGSLMTKCMIGMTLPLCLYAGLSFGQSIERSIPIWVQAYLYYASL